MPEHARIYFLLENYGRIEAHNRANNKTYYIEKNKDGSYYFAYGLACIKSCIIDKNQENIFKWSCTGVNWITFCKNIENIQFWPLEDLKWIGIAEQVALPAR